MDFPGGLDDKESACNAGGPRFNPWVRKIPWRKEWLPTPVFLPGESPWTEEPGSYSPCGRKESDMTEHACTHARGQKKTKFLRNAPDEGLKEGDEVGAVQ